MPTVASHGGVLKHRITLEHKESRVELFPRGFL